MYPKTETKNLHQIMHFNKIFTALIASSVSFQGSSSLLNGDSIDVLTDQFNGNFIVASISSCSSSSNPGLIIYRSDPSLILLWTVTSINFRS